MIESFLAEKEKYVKNVLMSKPKILARYNSPPMFCILCSLVCIIAIGFVWLKGGQYAYLLPLEIIPFETSDNILQLKVLMTTLLIVAILASLQIKFSRSYIITLQYLAVEKGNSTQIVMYEDIKKLKQTLSLPGFIFNKHTLKIVRQDNSALTLRWLPARIARQVKHLYKQNCTI